MSDIQEEQKRLYKRAEENDNRNELYGVKVIVSPEAHKELLKRKMIEENEILNDLQNRIDKAIEYINNCPEYLWANVNTKSLLDILKGDNK